MAIFAKISEYECVMRTRQSACCWTRITTVAYTAAVLQRQDAITDKFSSATRDVERTDMQYYSLRVLCWHRVNNVVFSAFIALFVTRLTYAATATASSWRRFTNASDRSPVHQLSDRPTPRAIQQHLMTVWHRRQRAVRLSDHILHVLLPPSSTASQRYNLTHRAHSLQLPVHTTQLSDSNFLARMLYKNTLVLVYWFTGFSSILHCLFF